MDDAILIWWCSLKDKEMLAIIQNAYHQKETTK